ncbi:hypothetical protein SEA_CARTHAGE_101 [Mycobacterium phage Carthage]|uniref:Uncharacterized protein n=1 Tax=Mycobacterium phage Robyn TaxID=2530145 RepID=A0A481W168_9CAUD|nr:hypothetical protein SEA_CARTHAGE_101 [Mycobacterium phage Carthage]QBI99640.1 hypothetical protein SEA_ROBYN_102 [Mycobacterium phage Robyn]
MSTITMIFKTGEYQQRVPVEDDAPIYVTVAGQIWQRDVTSTDATLLDGMFDAQSDYGQISWTKLTRTTAWGSSYDNTHGTHNRVLVIDRDNATAEDVLEGMLWLSSVKVEGV